MNSIKYQSLSDEKVDQLSIKIGLLPLEYRNILFFYIVLIIIPKT